MAERFGKGNRLAVDGRLETRSYEDRERNRRKAYEVVVERVSPIDWEEGEKADPFAGEGEPIEITDEDIPF